MVLSILFTYSCWQYALCLSWIPREYEWWGRLPIPEPCSCGCCSSQPGSPLNYNGCTPTRLTQHPSFNTSFNTPGVGQPPFKARKFRCSLILYAILSLHHFIVKISCTQKQSFTLIFVTGFFFYFAKYKQNCLGQSFIKYKLCIPDYVTVIFERKVAMVNLVQRGRINLAKNYGGKLGTLFNMSRTMFTL